MKLTSRSGPVPAEGGTEVELDVVASVLQRAVVERIITADQAAAVVALVPAPTAMVRRGRIPMYAEVFGYLGAVLVAIGAISLVAQFWDDLATGVRLAVLGGTAVLLWAVGVLVDENADPALWRLRSIIWLLATGSVAGFSALGCIDGFGWEGEPVAIATGATVAVASALLWRLQDRPAQHLSAIVGTAVAVGTSMAWADGATAVGAGLWVLGAVWITGGLLDRLPPQVLALAVGAGLTLLGAGLTADRWQGLGQAFGLLTATSLLALGAARDHFPLTGAGVVGLLIYVPSTATYYFADTIGVPLTLLASGIVLLVAALLAFRR